MKYFIVNPIIDNFNSVLNADNSLEAAKKAYDELSKYFDNIVNDYKFTLLKINDNDKTKVYEKNDNDFYHFNVVEKLDENNNATFYIQPYNKCNN